MRFASFLSLAVAVFLAVHACSPDGSRRMSRPNEDAGNADGRGHSAGAGGTGAVSGFGASGGAGGGGASGGSGGNGRGGAGGAGGTVGDAAPGDRGGVAGRDGAEGNERGGGFDLGISGTGGDGGVTLDGAWGADVRWEAGGPNGGRWMGGPMVVGVGNDGRRMVSSDGTTWVGDVRDASGNRDGPKVLRDVAYGNGVMVAVGGGCLPNCVGRLLTFDGRTWTEVAIPDDIGRLNGVAYGNGVWVAVGLLGPVLRSTDNGRTWVPTGRAGMPPGLRAVCFGRVGGTEMFVAVGDGYTRVRSVDGLNWTDIQPSNGSTDAFRAVTMGNGVAVAAGGKTDLGRLWRTTDGVTWLKDDDTLGGPDLASVVFVDGRFMAYSGTGDNVVHTSPDGRGWVAVTTSGAGSNVAAGYLGNTLTFISRVSPSTIKISNDGISWRTAAVSMQGDATINAFAFTE